ncbi:MAG: response regulator, partial [Acidimicrobiia bacterium]
MDWQNDPELEKLFKDELDERSRSLSRGAEAMLAGEITSELMGQMIREGHTIKGTGRVMGYEGIARGGEACEAVWRFIQLGELPANSMLARSLLLLAESIPHALGGDDAAVSDAIETLRTVIADASLLESFPEPLTPTSLTPQADSPEISSKPDAVPEEVESDSEAVIPPEAVAANGSAVREESAVESLPDTPAPELAAVSEIELDVEPLVFEPGPNGKLATPAIVYEFVSKTPDREAAGPVESAQADHPTESIDSASVDVPLSPTLVDEQRSVLDPDTSQGYDLGGLVGVVETWATEESVPVNAGRLFRMINDVAALRIDLDSVVRQASLAISDVRTGSAPSATQAALDSLEAVQRASVRLESAALGLSVVPISNVTSTLPQLVKYLSKKLDRDVRLVVEGEGTLIDRQLLDRIGEVIRQIVVNAVTHGLEPSDVRVAAGKDSHGTVTVAVSRDDQHVQLVISDDGAGIDWTAVRDKALAAGLIDGDPTAEALRSVLFADGFSTKPNSSEFTGSGSGFARVTEIVEEVFGAMTLDSVQRRGTTIVITMPAHRALQRAQMFTAGGRTWGFPDTAVAAILPTREVSISVTEKGSFVGFNNESVPYSSFASVAGLDVQGLPSHIMIIQSPTGLIALAVDEVLDIHEVATKDLGPLLSGESVVTGVALLGGDETVMLVDAGRLADNMRSVEIQPERPIHKVLVVDDSQGVREVVSGVLASHGFATVAAGSVSEALAALAMNNVDALVVDFSMPRADGVELIHMVRQRYGDIPVVMLSGVASPEDRARAERAGVNAFFDKADFGKGALVEKLRELIKDDANGDS